MTQQVPPSRPPSAPDIPVTNITQLETFRPDASGRPVQGMEISFTTPNMTRGTVFVPLARYTVQNVKAEIQARAAIIEGVHGLSG